MKNIIFTLLTVLFLCSKLFSQSPGCPNITPVGATICQGQCANLSATAVTNNQTTSYAVSSIPYSPFPYAGGTAVSVNTDDVWSAIVTIPFRFCFFGNNYNTIKLGSNGQIMFNPATGGGSDPWPVTAAGAIPSIVNTPGNTINVFRDINPAVSGTVSYYIGGTAPCRYLVFYFSNVALFSCNTPQSTFQMVLYETTNYIDINIGNSSGSCTGWSNGLGIVGIQNAAATVAYSPPGRNANNGNWTAVNEAWRFTPTGAPSYAVTWKGPGNVTVGTGLGPINVCPSASTTYTASMVITNCDGATTTYSNTALVTVNNSPTVTIAPSATLNCSGNTVITTTVTPASTYAWSGPGIVSGGGTGSPSVNQPGVYTVSATAGGCVRTQTINMVSPLPITLTANNANICSGATAVLTASGASTYTWNPGGSTSNPLSVSPASAATYTVIGRSVSGCTGTAVSSVVINPKPSATLSFTNPTCGNSNGVIVINNTSLGVQTITNFASNMGSVSGQTVTGLGAGTPIITLTNNLGCTFTVSTSLTNQPGPTNISITPASASCGNSNGSLTFGSPSGGIAPYTYSVNNVSATSPANGLPAATYSVTVRDANGCTFTGVATINTLSGPTAILGTSTPAGCGLTDGTYNITGVTGGSAIYTYSVDGVSTGSLTTSLAGGTHTVSVRDGNGCAYSTTFNVPQTSGPTAATINSSNASCGIANGTSTISAVVGGAPTYSFSFDGGAFTTSTSGTGLSAGPHSITIKDANSCTVTIAYNVLNNGSPTASISASSNVLCNGGSTGSFTATATGGSGGPFTYTLTSPLQSNGTGYFSGLPQGTYQVIAKDIVGCSTTATVTLTEPLLLTLTATPIAALCNGTASGTVNVSGSGGTPTYSYNLNGGAYQTTTSFANQFAAIYSIGIKDANGCTATQTVQVTQPAALTINVSSQNANCTAANGVASTTVTGGTGVITYTWSAGAGAAAVSNSVVAGNYTVTATDANGCSITSPITIGLTLGGTASVVATSSITCNGLCNGNITVGMTGGAAPFSYLWSPIGGTGANAANLCPGTYTCVVTDFYGCTSSASGTIIQPPTLTAIMNSNNVKCFGTTTGTVSAAGTGGTAPYTYLWTSPITNTAATVANVGIGNYFCNITDANNCSITQSISVTQPTSLTITSTVTAANCNQANGCATITVSGGSPTYIENWSNGTVGTSICNVTAGTYTVNITDANLCPQTLAVTIPNLSGPTLAISSLTNVSCFGGNTGGATATAAGGTGTYVYSWSNGLGVPVATNLIKGVYTASVTDQAGCVASASVSITEPAALTVNIVPVQPKCFGALNGGGSASAIGGTPSYSYAWTSTGGNTSVSNPLGAGNYGLTVTDGNGCVVTSSMALVNPPAMAASITSTNVSCFGLSNATAVATSTNGVGVLSYFWTGTPSPVSSQTLSNVPVGSYTLLATDQNSCTASSQVTITQPTQVTANITSTGSITCNGGNNGFAAVTAAGGTGAHTYNWLPSGITAATANTLTAGVYVVTVSDANLCTATATATILEPTPLATTLTTTNVKCNGAFDGTANIAYLGGAGTTTFLWGPTPLTGNPVNNLGAGPKTVTVTSNGSCPTVLSFTLTEPAALSAIVSSSVSNCSQANGKTCAVVSGGTGALTSLWSNGVSALCNNNVLAGAYTFSVTDANGCVAQASGLINDIAAPIVSVTSQTNVSCFAGSDGGAISSIVGGVSPYSIQWSGIPTFTTQNVSTGFNQGIKNITVTDAAGCVGTASVQITEPIQLASAVVSSTNVICFGQSNGGATVLATGGTGVYTYSWLPSTQTNSVLTNVIAGSATVVVTDANGCTSTSSVVISQPPALVMSATSFSNISCFGGSNGQVSTTVYGGFGGYTYTWLPSGSAPSLSGLTLGGYSVTVTDANNCPVSANFNITQPSALTSTYTSMPATCGTPNGSATVTIGGGTPTYSLVWSIPGTPTSSVVTGLAPGNWSVLGTDAQGCSITQIVNVANPPTSTITSSITTSPKCFGYSDGTAEIGYTAGSGPYTISWSSPISQTITTAALTQSVAGIGAGSYVATLTDANGCVTSAPVFVFPITKVILTPTPLNATICYGQTTQISASTSGGTGGYTYTWTPTAFVGGGPHTVNPTTTSVYNVAVTDINGCLDGPKNITINVKPQLIALAQATTICHGAQTVLTPSLSSNGNGLPYTYTWSPSFITTNTLSVIGNAPTTITTYTYGVTVDDGCSINSSVIFTVTVNALPTVNFVASDTVECAPALISFTATPGTPGNYSYHWENDVKDIMGNSNPVSYNFTKGDTVSVLLTITDINTGCKSTTQKTDYITIYDQPIASFYANPQSTSILDPNINFINTSQGATNYYWDFGDPAVQTVSNTSILENPSHTYGFVGEYKVNLLATSIYGCKDIAELIVEIKPDFALYVPNSFTPDGNGLNDVFQPAGVGINEDNYRMEVFDRWGESVFTSNAFRKGWDGTVKGGSKIAEQGVYVYKLQVFDMQGNKHPYIGHVTLIKKEN